MTEAQVRATRRAIRAKEAIEKACIENGVNLTIYDGKIGFVDPVENRIVLAWDAKYQAEGPRGGAEHEREGRKRAGSGIL